MDFNSVAISIITSVIIAYLGSTYVPLLVRYVIKSKASKEKILNANNELNAFNKSVLEVAGYREPNDEKSFEPKCYITTAKEIKDVLLDRTNNVIANFS
jgi:hypothetical protein